MATINVRLKNGTVVPMSHPDDWSPEQIENAIHENFPDETQDESQLAPTPFNDRPEPQKEETGLPGVASDAADMLSNALGGIVDFGENLPENLEKSGKYIEEHPAQSILHNAGQIASSAASLAKSTVNTPHDLLKYLLKKHLAIDIPIPGTKLHTSDLIPHIPEDTGLEKTLGLEANPEKGDAIFRAIPDVLAVGAGAKSLVKAAQAPSKSTQLIRSMENSIEEAKGELGLTKEQTDALKNKLKLDYAKEHEGELGALNPTDQEVKAMQKAREAGKAEEIASSIPEQEIKEIPPEPNTKEIVEKAKSNAERARKQAEEALGVLDNPRLKGGAIVQKAIKDVKQSSGDLYNQARSHYAEKQIKADNSKEIRDVTRELEELKNADDLAPGYGSGTAEQKELESTLEALKSEKVNASDIFDLQRTLEKMAANTRKRQYSGVNELEFKRLGSLAERLDNHANKLAKRLESVGGKDVQAMIKEANKGWKTFKELEKNSVGKAALNKGEIPSRAMIDIANTQSGNEFLRALTDAYPELKKHMLAAHVGESSVNKLLKPNTLTKKYLEALPEVEDKVNELKQAIAGIKEGEGKASKIKSDYDALVKSMKDAASQQKLRQENVAKSEKLKGQIEFHKKAIPKLEERIRVEKEAGRKVDRLEKELEDHKKQLQDKNHLLKKLGGMLLKATGISSIIHKAGL